MMPTVRDYLLAKEAAQTRYVRGPGEGERKCISCVRKRYGGPSCCDEGWTRYRGDDPGGCVNWTGWDTLAGPHPEPGARHRREHGPVPGDEPPLTG